MPETPRYDVTTKTYTDRHPGNAFLGEPRVKTTVRDNNSGKEYIGDSKSAQGSRDAAFKKARAEE